MALKIRLKRQGRRNQPFYRLIVADSRNPRDGRYVECLGWYNPREDKDENKLSLKGDRIEHWLNCGAILTEKAETLVKKGAPKVLETIQAERNARKLARKKKGKTA